MGYNMERTIATRFRCSCRRSSSRDRSVSDGADLNLDSSHLDFTLEFFYVCPPRSLEEIPILSQSGWMVE